MAITVHSTAIVDKNAKLGQDVYIGPYCLIGEGAVIGDGCKLQSHVTIMGNTVIGKGNTIYPQAVLGGPAQDIKSANSNGHSKLEIGNDNTIRECVTINAGTTHGGGKTVIGDNNYFMACSHVAHDCLLGSNIIMANCALLGGHIMVEDYAFISGQVAVHHFVTIGKHAFISGASRVPQDAPPFMITQGPGPEVRCVNSVGLRRHGYNNDIINALRDAHKIIWRMGLPRPDAIVKIKERNGGIDEVQYLIQFLENSAAGKNGRARESLRGKYEFEEDQS
jgi:UDP-N-acetylglucosamine acyltransferase